MAAQFSAAATAISVASTATFLASESDEFFNACGTQPLPRGEKLRSIADAAAGAAVLSDPAEAFTCLFAAVCLARSGRSYAAAAWFYQALLDPETHDASELEALSHFTVRDNNKALPDVMALERAAALRILSCAAENMYRTYLHMLQLASGADEHSAGDGGGASEPAHKRLRGGAMPPAAAILTSEQAIEYLQWRFYSVSRARYFSKGPSDNYGPAWSLQKLLFYANLLSAAKHGCTIVDESPQAWRDGPVYERAHQHFVTSLRTTPRQPTFLLADAHAAVLDAVVEAAVAGGHNPESLIELTHEEPLWLASRKFQTISDAALVRYAKSHATSSAVLRGLLAVPPVLPAPTRVQLATSLPVGGSEGQALGVVAGQ